MPFWHIATNGHALQVIVGETTKSINTIRGTLNATVEFNKLIKHSMI